jgi:hypothetical protein
MAMTRDRIDERLDRYRMMDRLQIAVAAGLLFVFLYSIVFVRSGGFWAILGVGMLTAGGSLLAGFLLGFIFGVPRTSKDASNTPSSGQPQSDKTQDPSGAKAASIVRSNVQTNSNLVEISDWLTKILVGVGLVELNKIPAKIEALTKYVGSGLRACGDQPTTTLLPFKCEDVSQAVALAIVVFFFCAGFLIAYLWALIYFQRALSELATLASDVDKGWDYADKAEQALDDGNLADAIGFIDLAVSSDPHNASAHLIKGVILKRMALAPDQTLETKNRLLEEALNEATQSAKLRPSVGGAFYNMACYQALLGRDHGSIIKNLQQAFSLDPKLKSQAPTDADLKAVWDDPDFKKITSAAG